jgi:SAM-dependent methyltransferase
MAAKIISYIKSFKRIVDNKIAYNKKLAVLRQQMEEFKAQAHGDTSIPISQNAYLYDNTGTTYVEPHYTYHPAWAARVLSQIKPAKHIDISSITHFGTIVSAFIPVEFYDYRPAHIILPNYATGKADLSNLHFETNSIESLSCMHTVEHIGLGRYGDPIDYYGDVTAMKELARVLKVGGNLLFVTPIGIPRVEFNAHRVYSYESIIEMFSGLKIKEFSLIPDDFANVGYVTNPPAELVNSQSWGCGCFWFTKE